MKAAACINGDVGWRAPQFLGALLARPFGWAEMDRSIAYELSATEAAAFYVQSAATVQSGCEVANGSCER